MEGLLSARGGYLTVTDTVNGAAFPCRRQTTNILAKHIKVQSPQGFNATSRSSVEGSVLPYSTWIKNSSLSYLAKLESPIYSKAHLHWHGQKFCTTALAVVFFGIRDLHCTWPSILWQWSVKGSIILNFPLQRFGPVHECPQSWWMAGLCSTPDEDWWKGSTDIKTSEDSRSERVKEPQLEHEALIGRLCNHKISSMRLILTYLRIRSISGAFQSTCFCNAYGSVI